MAERKNKARNDSEKQARCKSDSELKSNTKKTSEKIAKTQRLLSTHFKNVSRETFDGVKAENNAKAQQPDKTVSFVSLYSCFRENGLSKVESAFNAAYLYCADRYYTSHAPVKKQYENIYMHPKAWQKHEHSLWKSNKWSAMVSVLDIVPKIKRGFENLYQTLKKKRLRADLWRRIEYSHMAHEFYKGVVIVAGVVAFLFVVSYGTKGALDMTKQIPAVSIYIDDMYVGDVLSVSDAQKAKAAYESVVSMSIRANFDLDCSVAYKPTLCQEKDVLTTAQLNAAFDAASRRTMKSGYGLYVDGVLVAVCESRQWIDQALTDSLAAQLGNYRGTQSVSYNNAITVSAGVFPASLYMSQSQVRELFSLEKVTKADKEKIQNNTILRDFYKPGSVAEQSPSAQKGQLTINAANAGQPFETLTAITDSSGGLEASPGQYAVMNIAVQKQEILRESVDFKTIRMADPTLAENKTRLVQKGKTGLKDVTYVVNYVGNTETDRYALSENIIVQPVDCIEIIGTRPLTEEEKRTASTGTYIWPSNGTISSGYSWRVIFNKNEFHKGLDICDEYGSDVVASDGGVVIKAGMDRSGYGNMVLIQHDDGTLTRYAHNSKLYVKEGQRVAQGELIAAMGKTGQATGVHVHFEVIVNDSAKNPMKYLPERE